MRAITVAPKTPDSVRLEELAEPDAAEGSTLVEAVALGVCGTDIEILAGEHGAPPDGAERLILGHESLGRVLEAPDDSGFAAGDLGVGIHRGQGLPDATDEDERLRPDRRNPQARDQS